MTARETGEPGAAGTGRPDVTRAGRSDADPAVAVQGLRKSFPGSPDPVTAVDGVSFEIERGSLVGLLGANGAGKTTLIRSILGTVLPDAGSVRICGIDVRKRPRSAHAKVDALLEGARNDYWRLTVEENLRYFATIGGLDPDSVADRHDRLLDRLGLAGKADVPVRELSRGMKQKVSLASVLAGGAEVVFLDEPTLGLDVGSARSLQRELRRLAAERGLTVVLSSHDMDVVERVCDRVLVMADGRLVTDERVDDLLGRGAGVHAVRIASADFDAGSIAALRERFSVTGSDSRDGGGRQVRVRTEDDGLYALMEFLAERGVTIDHLSTVDPDLEAVFLDLVDGDGDGDGDGR